MMITVVLIIAGVLLLLVVVVLLKFLFGILPRDLCVYGGIMLPVFWMSRLDAYFVLFEDSPFVLLQGMFGLIILFLWLLSYYNTVSLIKPKVRKVLTPLMLLSIIFLLSVIFNASDRKDWFRGILGLCYVVLPSMAALTLVRLYRLDETTISRAVTVFLLAGVFTAILSIISAVAPGLFRNIVTTFRTEAEVGRAFTPIGGANATAAYLLMPYCLATSQMLAGRRRIFSVVVLSLCFLGILTTLARAGIIVFAVVTVYLYAQRLRGTARRILVLSMIIVCLFLPLGYHLSKKYSLERFVEGAAGTSASLRVLSLKAALNYGAGRLLAGGGWGLVYDLQRRKAILVREEAQTEISLDGLPSAASPHNLFALVFAEAGLPGLLLLLIYFKRIWNTVALPDPDIERYGYQIVRGFRASLLSIFVMALFQDHLFLSDNLSYTMYLVTFMGIAVSSFFCFEEQQLSQDDNESYQTESACSYYNSDS